MEMPRLSRLVRRNLFGPVDHRQLQQDFQALLAVGMDLAKVRWGFNFQSDRPTSSSSSADVESEELQARGLGGSVYQTTSSSTATLVHNHVLVVPEHHVVIVVVVQHGDGREADGHTAWLWGPTRVQRVHQRLQDGVVCAVQALAEWEGALAVAVVGQVALRRDDPVLPAHVLEVDVEAPGFAHVAGRHGQVDGTPPLPGAALLRVERHSHQHGMDLRRSRGCRQRGCVAGVEGDELLLGVGILRLQRYHQAVVAARFAPGLGQGGQVQYEGGGLGSQRHRLG
ncbi:hypothetical protein CRUP_037763 [Coryphaenoides rupestris]|nr:hypothetical protein CRUP_037763 [Coryphaenoides rupestris]